MLDLMKKGKNFFKDHIVKFPTYSYSEKDLLSEECVLKQLQIQSF